MTAQICVPRNLQCGDAPTEVRYDFALPAGLGQSSSDSIKATVLEDLKRQWDAKLLVQSNSAWVSAQDLDNYYQTLDKACVDEPASGGHVRHQCRLVAAACNDLPPQKIPPGTSLELAR